MISVLVCLIDEVVRMLFGMRLLIVKLSSIGDVVHTLPALAAIHRQLPDVEVSWVVEKRAADILRNNPLLSRLIVVDTRILRHKSVLGKTIKTAKRQLRDLRASEFDLSIDFQGLLKSASISRFSGARFRAGFSKENLREPACRHFYTNRFKVDPKTNIIVKNIGLAEKALQKFLKDKSFELDHSTIDFPISTESVFVEEAARLRETVGDKFVILNPAGGWVTKLWPAENFGMLADAIYEEFGFESLVCTAPNEKPLAELALGASQNGRLKIAQPSLKGFYELAKLAHCYIGGDTAPTHLAVAADCPVVGVFGPTEWWRNGSPNENDVCVERNDIDCRIDCHRRTCGKWICMDIPVEQVMAGIRSRINSVPI